jgi:serine/threonine-protein kinase
MSTCSKCHRDAPAGALFCAFCGGAIAPDQPPGEPPDPFIGRTLKGTYFIQQKVGGGGMGQVYKATHVTLDAPVAVKILKKALLADPSVVQRFQREARAASRLRHPNVISVTDFGQIEDGTLFMAMEYVAGRNLARIIAEESPLAERRIVHIGAQILAALAEAHANDILHRDLKPENVMVEARRDEADSVKVLDFGIAKIQTADSGQSTLTQAGLVCGTPGYMSPEQWDGKDLDRRSDVYAVGVILYEMLTGKLPFEAQTPMEMVRKHLTEKPQPPSERRPDRVVSPDLEALVMRALEVDRELRPASAEEMRSELLACIVSADTSVPAQTDPPKTVVFQRPGRPTPGRPTSSRPPSQPPHRPATPGGTRRPTPGARPSSAVPREPRHEMDDDDGADEGEALPPPSRKGPLTLGLAVGAAVAAVGVALGAYFLRPAPAQPEPTPKPPPLITEAAPDAGPAQPVVQAEPADAGPREAPPPPRQPEPQPEPVVRRDPQPEPRPRTAEPRPDEDPTPAERPRSRAPTRVSETLNAIRVPSAVTGEGVLTIQAEPYGEVYLDDRPYGEAPREFRIPAGVYRVRAKHPSLGVREAKLKVKAGARTRWTADFTR